MLRRTLIALAAVWFGLALACAQTPNLNILRMNSGYTLAVYTDFTQTNSTLPPSLYTYSGASLRTITDATGAITSAPNCLLLNNATLSTQGVTVGPQWNYLLSFYGTGSVTLSGAATGTLNGTGANNQVYLKVTGPTVGTLTLTVSGSVTRAVLSAITYETTPRPGDQVVTTSAAYYGPAFDYSSTTLAPLGLRIEEARTNLFLNSGSPATQTVTVASGQAYSISFYGTGVLTLSGALTQVMTGSAYPTRTTYTGTTLTTSLVVTVTTLGTMSYPQVELGGFATSAIPTGASSVTRSADVVGIVGVALGVLQGAQGAIVAETNNLDSPSAAQSPSIIYGNVVQSWFLRATNATNAYSRAGAAVLSTPLGSGSYTGIVRSGVSFNGSGRSLVGNGGSIANDNALFQTPSSALIGSIPTTKFLDGYITKLALYSTALPAAVLQRNTLLTTVLH
jgi:hypothetical protein